MYQVIFYVDKKGNNDVYEYIQNLRNTKNNKDAKIGFNKIVAYINQLSKNGLTLGEPYIKHIDGYIWELRPLRYRILFANLNNNKFILLSLFKKQTKKTPKREINKARRLLEEYKNRSDGE